MSADSGTTHCKNVLEYKPKQPVANYSGNTILGKMCNAKIKKINT